MTLPLPAPMFSFDYRDGDALVTEFAYNETQMLEYAALCRADEREACAKIVEVEAMQYAEPVWAFEIVNDIRCRSKHD